MHKVYFSKNNKKNSYVKMDNKHYLKKKIYSYFVRKNKNITYSNIVLKDNVAIIKISLKLDNERDTYILYMLRKDRYYKKFKNLLKPNIIKKLFIIFGMSVVLTLLIKKDISLISTYNMEKTQDDSFDDLFNIYECDDILVEVFKSGNLVSNSILEKTSPYVEAFNIDKTVDTVIVNASIEKECVGGNYIYSSSTNNIDKDRLVTLLLANGISDQMTRGLGYIYFSEAELNVLTDNIYDYIENMKAIDPNFDVKHFACSLEKLCFYKNINYTSDQKDTYAFYSDYSIVYNLFDSKEMSFDEWIHVTNHELTHLENCFCPCDLTRLNVIYKNGIGILCPYLSDNINYQPYNYIFLDENFAEDVSSLMDNDNVTTYLPENQVTDNIEFALCVNPNYEVGTILRNCIEQDPISFYQNFPYLYDTKEELTSYIEMLKCYDYSLENGLGEYLSVMGDIDIDKEEISNDFKDYAYVKHIELFYKNLYILNEESNTDISLYTEDLIKLFTSLMIKENNDSYSGDNSYLLEALLISYYNDFKDNYLVYKYPNYEFFTINDINSIMIDSINYPDFVDLNKRRFIDNLINNYSIIYGVNNSSILKK